jgi:hypothetical protein
VAHPEAHNQSEKRLTDGRAHRGWKSVKADVAAFGTQPKLYAPLLFVLGQRR